MLMAPERPLTAPETPLESTPEELMARFVAGDRRAFDTIYEYFGPRVRAFINRYVAHPDAGDDILQEVFLKVYRKSETFDPAAHLSTWLFAIARNACIDWLRRRKLPTVSLSPTGDDDTATVQVADPAGVTPADRASTSELSTLFDRAVERLSPKLREVFLLCGVQGLAYEEAAVILGCPVKTVSSRLSRARAQLQEELGEHLGVAGERRER